MGIRRTALAAVDQRRDRIIDVSQQLWRSPELSLQEDRSAAVLTDLLEAEGFTVTTGIAGLSTAFLAEYRSPAAKTSDPTVGILAEYDALPGLSQKAQPTREPLEPGGPGHGCGHNLFGPGSAAAAIAVKEAMVEHGVQGTIRCYGCPAEELLLGKVIMVREGAFEGCDAILTWHPAQANTVSSAGNLAVDSARFTFHGRASHASVDPHHGRSALDAVELMNVAANYMREHVPSDTRIHYVITDGGGKPNVVPARAQVWYYVRSPRREGVRSVFEWLCEIARGAAIMTQTTHEMEVVASCYDLLPNRSLGELLWADLQAVGAIAFDPEEHAFAAELVSSLEASDRSAASRHLPEGIQLLEGVTSPEQDGPHPSSSDTGDVSWVVPLAQLRMTCAPVGTPGHSWQVTAASGMSIGHKGMLGAARVLALTAVNLLGVRRDVLNTARAEFEAVTSQRPYRNGSAARLTAQG